MNGKRGILSLITALVALAMFAGACDDDGAPAELIKVSINTDWVIGSGYTPLLLADEKGYFAEEGLDIEIGQGGPDVAGLEAVNAGDLDFIYGSIDEVPYAVGEGMEIRAVAAFTHKNPNAIIVTGDSPIQGMEDLADKTIGIPLGGGPPYAMLPDILRSAGVDPDTVQIVEVDDQIQVPGLLSGQFDTIDDYFPVAVPKLRREDPNVRYYTYNDYGFDFLGGYSLLTSTRLMEEQPEVVRGVVRAILRAWADAANNPAESIDTGATRYPENFLEPDLHVEGLELYLTMLETPDTMTYGLGYMTDEEWQSLVDASAQYGGLETVLPVENYYTNEFLPEEPIQP